MFAGRNTTQPAVLLLLGLLGLHSAVASRLLLQRGGCPCPRIFKPVCSADGQFYANECLATCAGAVGTTPTDQTQCSRIAVDPLGPTQQLGEQPQQLQQFLVDTNTRPTGGSLLLAARPLNTNSLAQQQLPSTTACRCPKIYSLVCGSDGQTYNNQCLAECAGASVVPCSNVSGRNLLSTQTTTAQVCACPRIYKPVCGANGRVYDNECIARCEGVATTASPLGGKCPVVDPVGPVAAGPAGSAGAAIVDQQVGSAPIGGPVTTTTGAGSVSSSGSGVAQQQPQQPQPQQPGPVVGATPRGPGMRPTNPRQPVGGLGLRCGCPVEYNPVCGKDGFYYPTGACAATCESGGVSAVQPDSYGNCLVGH